MHYPPKEGMDSANIVAMIGTLQGGWEFLLSFNTPELVANARIELT